MIFHVALRKEWEEAVDAGTDYRRSTLGRSLDEVGFIHCSYDHQVDTILSFYEGQEIVILEIDEASIPHEIRVENEFPHIYGALPLNAVVRVDEGQEREG